jgi:two-component system sensor histidine kinase UhpB
MYHAQASHVKIRIEEIGDTIALSIIDDGKGFDISQATQTSGLTSMRKRVISINGQLTIRSEPGIGTSVTVTIKKP